MKVLVVETEPHAADIATEQLVRCHEPEAETAFPCIGLSGHCPLEEDEIDVALTVRGAAQTGPTPFEDGITCALRQRVPVVVAGRTSPNPFEPFGAAPAEMDIVGTCERVAASHRMQHESVAKRALDWTLSFRGLPTTTAHADVVRSGAGLRVTLFVPAETPKVVQDMAAVRVTGALRAFDPFAPRIEISCEAHS